MTLTKCVKDTQANNDALRDICNLAAGMPVMGSYTTASGNVATIPSTWDSATPTPVGWTQHMEANWFVSSSDTALPISNAEVTLLQSAPAQARLTAAQQTILAAAIAARQDVDLKAGLYQEKYNADYSYGFVIQRRSWPTNPFAVGIVGQSNAGGLAQYDTARFGPYVIDPRVTFFAQGVLRPFQPRVTDLAQPTHGVEIALAPALANATGRAVAIGKSWVSGTSIDTWLPASGSNWHLAVDMCAALVQANSSTQAHIIWAQGETDAQNASYSQATYTTNLQAVIAGLRTQMSPLNVRIHIMRVNSHVPSAPSLANIVAAMDAVQAADGNAAIYNTDAFTPNISSIHWDCDQYNDIWMPPILADIQANT